MNIGADNESPLMRVLTGVQVSRSMVDFLEAAFDAIVAFDPQERIVYWNPAAAQMFGWTEQEAWGKTSAELFWPIDTSKEEESHRQRQLSLKQGATLWGEHTVSCKNGSSIWVQYTIRGVFEAEGKFTGYLALYRDITVEAQLHAKEKQLQQSNQKLNDILQSIQDDFYVLDHEWNFVYTSKSFTSKIGKEPKDFVGNNIWEMFPKHLGTAYEANVRAAMEKREIRSFEIPGKYTNAWYRMKVFPSAEGITVLGTDITERRQAEEQLRYQATLLSNVNDAIVASDAQFCITAWNTAAESLYGWKAEEVLGRNGLEIVRTEWASQDASEMRRAIGELGCWRGEATQARKDGTRFPVEISSIALYDTDRQITGYISVNRDITQRKLAEDQLRELSQRLTYHVDNSPLAVIEWGSDMRLIRWSAAAERMFGWKAEEVLGKRIEDLRWVYDEDTEQVKDVSSDLQTGTDLHRVSANRNYRKDGSIIYCEWYNSSLVDEAGNLRSILSLVLDVTDRRRAQQELAQSEERYRHLVKYAPTGIYEIDIKTMRFLEVNESMCQILGYTREELLSTTPGDLLNEEGRVRFRERMLKMIAGEEVSPQTEYIVKAKDGHEIWGLLTTTINYDQGKPRSVSVVAHDITERKRAEEALRQNEQQLRLLNETLEQKVQEKTAEVRRLASDLTKAEQRERRRISRVLHDDLQQRIYAIQMQFPFLRDEVAENKTAQKEVSDIERQLDEIVQLSRQLSVDLNPPILHDEGLTHAINWLAAQMRRQYGLPIEVAANGPFVIPEEEIQGLLFNCIRELLFNVVKHAEASHAVVGLEWLDRGLRIEVRDDGKGFPIRTAELQQNEEMSEEEEMPPGLGLVTIRRQLSLFGGCMEIESELGAGSRIILMVPINNILGGVVTPETNKP